MRLMTELEGINIEYENSCLYSIHNNYMNLKIINAVSIFLKNLDYKLTQSLLVDKVEKIYIENSFWRQLGFVEIFNLDTFILSINCENDEEIKSNFEINSIHFHLCKDSFKYLLRLISHTRQQIFFMKNIIISNNDDVYSVITELEMIQDKNHSEQVRFPSRYENFNNGIEYKRINVSKSPNKLSNNIEQDNNNNKDIKKVIFNKQNSYSANIKRKNSPKYNLQENLFILDAGDDKKSSNNYNSNDVNKKKKDNKDFNSNNFMSENVCDISFKKNIDLDGDESVHNFNNDNINTNKVNEKLNLYFNVHNLKIYLFEGKDFSFEDRYINSENFTVVNTSIPFIIMDDYMEKIEKKEIIKENNNIRARSMQRKYSDYIRLVLNEFEINFFYYQ
jgi:hypothetical protein